MKSLPLADTQPNPGWGFICASCKHTYDDAEKYVDYAPSTPCKRLQFSRGGYDSQMRYQAPAPIFDLRRYVDGSESCPKYEKSQVEDGELTDAGQYKYWMVHPCDATKAANEFHDDQSKAEAYAFRLAKENPGRRFGVLELVSCFQVPIATEPISLRVEHRPMPKTEDD